MKTMLRAFRISIGQPYIDIAPGAFRSGDTVVLKLATSPDSDFKAVSWTFDNVKFADGNTVTLDAGWHTASAVITCSDGSKVVLEREIEVK